MNDDEQQTAAKAFAKRLWELSGEIGTAAELGNTYLGDVYEALGRALDACENAGLIEIAA